MIASNGSTAVLEAPLPSAKNIQLAVVCKASEVGLALYEARNNICALILTSRAFQQINKTAPPRPLPDGKMQTIWECLSQSDPRVAVYTADSESSLERAMTEAYTLLPDVVIIRVVSDEEYERWKH